MKLSLIAKESLVQKTQQKELYINYTSCMTLMLKIANHFFLHDTLAMLMYHHIQFGHKRLNGSEDILWTHGHGDSNTRLFFFCQHEMGWGGVSTLAIQVHVVRLSVCVGEGGGGWHAYI